MKWKLLHVKYRDGQGGFVALLSTLILTAILMIVISATSTSSFFARFDALSSEFKRISLGLSEACSNAVLLKIAQKYDYSVNGDSAYNADLSGVVVNVGTDICLIKSVTYEKVDENIPLNIKKRAIIETSAQYPLKNGSWSKNKIKVFIQNPAISDATSLFIPLSIDSWE